MSTATVLCLFIISLVCNIVIAAKLYRSRKDLNMIRRAEEFLFQLGDEITRLDNMDEVFKRIVSVAVEIIPNADKGSLLILEEDGMFHFKCVMGYDEDIKSIILAKEEIFLYKINNFKETAIIREPLNFDKKELVAEKAREIDIKTGVLHCTLSTPIYIDDKLIGLINVDSVNEKKYFKQSDINLMDHIKNQLVLSLKNSYIRGKLTYLTNYDDLTGIYNRRYFNKKLAEQLNLIRDENERSYLVEIDLDNFKAINDYSGHAAGDSALILFSKILKESLKNGEIYGRMSGDEFIIFFKDIEVSHVVEAMGLIEQRLQQEAVGLKVGFSYGITEINLFNSGKLNEIYAAADMEMYKHKRWKKSYARE